MSIYDKDYCYVALYEGRAGCNLKASEYDMALTAMGSEDVHEFIGIFGDVQHIRGKDICRVTYWSAEATEKYKEQRAIEKLDSTNAED